MNYEIIPKWDTSMSVVFKLGDVSNINLAGLAYQGIKSTAGAPAATAKRWIPGATVYNAVTGINYQNTGSTASPVWSVIDTGAGFSLPTSASDSTTTTGTSFAMTFSALTSGAGQKLTGPGAGLLAGGIIQDIVMGASTVGLGQRIINTGFYTGTGIRQLTANAATTGILDVIFGTGLTTGIARKTVLAAATLTTGRYESYNDGAVEVFGVGANGHLHTAQTTAPTVGTVTAHGITAAAVTAGSTDVCGQITTTGTQDNSADSVIPIVFNKTYTVAPKSVTLTPLNNSGAGAGVGNSLPYISATSATGFSISVSKSAAAGATPSWTYQVIA